MTSTDPKPDENPTTDPVAETAADAPPGVVAADSAVTDDPADPAAADTGAQTADPAALASPEPAAAAQPAVVFVEAPKPPRVRGARGVGVLVALLGAGLFAAAYAGLVLVLGLLTGPEGTVGAVRYLATPTFWIPVIVFALAYILLIVIVNRAGWWAHVLGGFLVAIVVWIGFVGAALIAAGAVGAPSAVVAVVVAEQLTNPLGFAAAIAAREVPVWVGWIVARRGRTARARNQAARTAYEQELAEHRATVAGRSAV